MKQLTGSPLFEHDLASPSAFLPEDVVDALRCSRSLALLPVPPICVLDFDGDLSDWLVSHGVATVFEPWACFHTRMLLVETDGLRCGVIARTVGGPYAVLVAEQLRVSGVRLILGLTSAGRLAHSLPLPSLVIITSALRDEGTSLHYLPAGERVDCPTPIGGVLAKHLGELGLPLVQGAVWTTDAPYRETREQLERHAVAGILAVEMQAASLFAFATATDVNIGMVAHLTNATDHPDEQFDKGREEDGFVLLRAMLRAGHEYLEQMGG